MIIRRVLFGIFLVISAFIFQWWVSFILAIIGLFYYDNLYESVLVGLIIDSLYGKGIELFFLEDFDFVFTLIMVIVFIMVTSFKKKLLI